MKINYQILIIFIAIVFLGSCSGHDHDHSHDESFYEHSHDHSHDPDSIDKDIGPHERHHDEFDYDMLDFDETQGWHEGN